MKKCLRLKIIGKVQGVFFRAACKEKASELGIFGWAGNRADGSVEILAEGEDGNLGEFLRWCQKGSEKAEVNRVEVAYLEGNKDFESFEIR